MALTVLHQRFSAFLLPLHMANNVLMSHILPWAFTGLCVFLPRCNPEFGAILQKLYYNLFPQNQEGIYVYD